MVKLFALLAVFAVFAAACGKFEDPTIVIDTRVLSMVSSPPEQLVPITPNQPPDPSKIHLAPFQISALVADPGVDRPLQWDMIACPPENNDRCDPSKPSVMIGGGTMPDPDANVAQDGGPDAELDASPALFQVVLQAAKDDPFGGFTSIDIMVQMRVYPAGATDDQAIYASKGVRFGSEDPPGRTPNQNPTLTELDWSVGPAATATAAPLPLALCAQHDSVAFPVVAPGTEVNLAPVEPDGAREVYVVPTFDGGSETLTENLSYDWFVGAGKLDSGSTGGPRDPFGNDPPIVDQWIAPTDPVDRYVPLYVVQRDERLGQAWYVSCVHVTP